MKKNNYGIKDNCAKVFINTFHAENDETAERSFKRDILNAPETVPVEDFILCKLGTFDDEKGVYENDFKFISAAVDYLKFGGDSCNTTPIQTDQK